MKPVRSGADRCVRGAAVAAAAANATTIAAAIPTFTTLLTPNHGAAEA